MTSIVQVTDLRKRYALREISTTGATLADVGVEILGLLIWSVVAFVVAYRFFRLD